MRSTISVIGLGYLGVTQALVLTKLGHKVIGVDLDSSKLRSLKSGSLGFFEPGLQELLDEALESQSLSLFESFTPELSKASIHFICVGTPSKDESGEVDLSAVEGACQSLGHYLGPNALVVGRSTVPIGTSDFVKDILEDVAGFPVRVAWNPEFLSEGSALVNSFEPDRIVIGVDDSSSEKILRELYAPLTNNGAPLLVMDRRTSELVKVASNSFLATKVSFINGVASVAEKTGASASLLAQAMGLDPRIGTDFLKNGIGFGGGCLPKDLAGFRNQAESIGATEFAALLGAVSMVNKRRLLDTLGAAEEILGTTDGAKIAILGASFKPNTDDIRDSPGLLLATSLQRVKATLSVHDPVVRTSQVIAPVLFSNTLEEVIVDADLLIVATDWPLYANLDPFALCRIVKKRNVIDGRGVLDHNLWASAGWNVVRLGEGIGAHQ